jgi:deoxyribodipyrimidine photo-lyase
MSLGFIIRKSKCNLVQRINTIRIYSPIKNSEDHDPEGVLSKMVGAADIPVNLIHEPWLNPIEQQFYNCNRDYPEPIVNIEETKIC